MSQNYPGPNWQGGPQPPQGYGPQQPGPQPGQFGQQGAPQGYGPGPGGPQGPGFGPGGPGYPPGPPPKKKTGLFIGIGAGALVLVVGIVVLALVLLGGGGPTLTSAQFDKVFAQGDSIDGNTIDKRETTEPNFGSANSDCERKVVDGFKNAADYMSAVTKGYSIFIVGVRFKDTGGANKAYDALNGPCAGERTDSGEVDGAKYMVISVSNSKATIVKMGNIVIFGGGNTGAKDFAREVAKEIKDSAK